MSCLANLLIFSITSVAENCITGLLFIWPTSELHSYIPLITNKIPRNRPFRQWRKTPWRKYPYLYQLSEVDIRTMISFFFFSFLFLLSTSDFIGFFQMGSFIIFLQLYAGLITSSAVLSLRYGIETFRPIFLVPVMVILLGEASLFVGLAASVLVTFMMIPATQILSFLFHSYLFAISFFVILVLLKSCNCVWFSFWNICDAHRDEDFLRAVRGLPPLEHSKKSKRNQRISRLDA